MVLAGQKGAENGEKAAKPDEHRAETSP